MRRIIFSKYSNDRDRRFAIRTDIVRNDDGGADLMEVEKHAMFPEGSEHLERQSRYFAEYSDRYSAAGLELAEAGMDGGTLRYQFIDGDSVSDRIDAYIDCGDADKAADLLLAFCERIRDLYSVETWKSTEQFGKVFGTVDFANVSPEGIKGCSFADIDLVPENIIVSGDKGYVTDYEWIFDFPIPADYVVYRAIRTYMYSGGKRNMLMQHELYERVGISDEARSVFDNMESNFQKYVKGSRVTAAELYEDIGKPVYYGEELMELGRRNEQQYLPIVYLDYGEGFSEDNKIVYKRYDRRYEIELTQDIKRVRFDPRSLPCVLTGIKLCGNEVNQESQDISFNGEWYDTELVFKTDDPQLIVDNPQRYAVDGKLVIEVCIEKITKEYPEKIVLPPRTRADILYQFDERYAPYAGVSITSLFENNRHIDDINVYILGDGLSDESVRRLDETAGKYGRRINYIDTTELVEMMKRLNIPAYRGSYTANFKLFVPMVIAKNIDRLLYIDSDTVVTGDIMPLFDMPMEGMPVGMSLDSLGVKHKALIGLSADDGYYNTGVMLFDLQEWKKQMCTEKIIEHVQNVRAHYMSPDQDLANVVLRQHIYRLGAEYNVQPVHMVYDYDMYTKSFGQPGYYGREEIDAAVERPVIIHFFRFLGQFPWDEESVHPDTQIFDHYLGISEWKDYSKVPSRNSGTVFKIERWLYRHLSKRTFLKIFKLNYDIFIKKAEKNSRSNKNDGNM
jgi:lipopolysaccharide biosynthesis glycosyltransferase